MTLRLGTESMNPKLSLSEFKHLLYHFSLSTTQVAILLSIVFLFSHYDQNHPLGDRKVKFGSKRAIFGVIWGGFCLEISHPTNPHLGEISQKNFFLDAFPKPMTQCKNGCRILSHGISKFLRACRNFGKVNA